MKKADNHFLDAKLWYFLATAFASELALGDDEFMKAVFTERSELAKANPDLGICAWKEEDGHNEYDPVWETSCDQTFIFTEGGPKENEMNYCCFCGKNIKEKK